MTLGDRRGDVHALVDSLADTLAEVETLTLGDRWGDAQNLEFSIFEAKIFKSANILNS